MATGLPPGFVAFGPGANCTLDDCPIEYSILRYRPSVPASAVFIAIFGVSMLIHAYQGIRSRTWSFMGCMLAGCIVEMVGYGGRLILYDNPFSFNGFIMQIVCITIAPVFFCSAIYVLLSQVILFIDTSLSRCKPQLFYWIFIPCDIVSLVLQAAGGALSCVARTYDAVQIGVDISLAGLVFQVVTLIIFVSLFADYLYSCRRKRPGAMDGRMTLFLTFMFLSIMFILVRCAFRIYELHDGYFSEVFRDEPMFIALESSIMSVAVVCLNIGHPGPVLGKKAGDAENKQDTYTEMTPWSETDDARTTISKPMK